MHRDLYPDEGKRRKPFLNMEMDLKTATSTMEALVRISVSICLFACVVAGYMAYQIRGFFYCYRRYYHIHFHGCYTP